MSEKKVKATRKLPNSFNRWQELMYFNSDTDNLRACYTTGPQFTGDVQDIYAGVCSVKVMKDIIDNNKSLTPQFIIKAKEFEELPDEYKRKAVLKPPAFDYEGPLISNSTFSGKLLRAHIGILGSTPEQKDVSDYHLKYYGLKAAALRNIELERSDVSGRDVKAETARLYSRILEGGTDPEYEYINFVTTYGTPQENETSTKYSTGPTRESTNPIDTLLTGEETEEDIVEMIKQRDELEQKLYNENENIDAATQLKIVENERERAALQIALESLRNNPRNKEEDLEEQDLEEQDLEEPERQPPEPKQVFSKADLAAKHHKELIRGIDTPEKIKLKVADIELEIAELNKLPRSAHVELEIMTKERDVKVLNFVFVSMEKLQAERARKQEVLELNEVLSDLPKGILPIIRDKRLDRDQTIEAVRQAEQKLDSLFTITQSVNFDRAMDYFKPIGYVAVEETNRSEPEAPINQTQGQEQQVPFDSSGSQGPTAVALNPVDVPKYHKDAILLMYGNNVTPDWDPELEKTVRSAGFSQEFLLESSKDIVANYGPRIFVREVKTAGTEQEFLELIQLMYSFERGLLKGPRSKNALVSIKDLTNFSNSLLSTTTTDTTVTTSGAGPGTDAPADITPPDQVQAKLESSPNAQFAQKAVGGAAPSQDMSRITVTEAKADYEAAVQKYLKKNTLNGMPFELTRYKRIPETSTRGTFL